MRFTLSITLIHGIRGCCNVRQIVFIGRECMYINSYLESNVSDLWQYCIEKVTEVCAAQINIENIIMHIQMS